MQLVGDHSLESGTEVVFDAASKPGNRIEPSGGILTVKPGAIIRTGAGGWDHRRTSGATLVNQGLIWAKTAGQPLTVEGNWSNQGTLKVSDDGILALGGVFTPAQIGNLEQVKGTVRITGKFDNTGSTLAPIGTGTWELDGGTIIGGTISAAPGIKYSISHNIT